MSDESYNENVRPPPGQEHEDYLQTVEAFHAWCEARGLPFRPEHNRVLRAAMGDSAQIAAPSACAPSACAPKPRRNRAPDVRGRRMIQRLAVAMDLLITTDKSMTEIAAQAGFSSLSLFSDGLKRHTGQSPRKFRAAHRRSE